MSDFYHQYDLLYEGCVIMLSLRQYVLTIISMAMICSLVQQLFKDNHHAGVLKIICGSMITLTVLQPLLRIDDIHIDSYFKDITSDSYWAVEEGEANAEHAAIQIIRDKTSAYICDKANTLGASLSVDVELSGSYPPIPSRFIIRGAASPYVKKQIVEYIHNEFGVSEENQLWIS